MGGTSTPIRRGAEFPENARLQLAGAGSPAADAIATPDQGFSAYTGPLDEQKPLTRHGLAILLGIVFVVAIITGLVLFVIPVPHSFSGSVNGINGPTSFDFPKGSPVNVNWQSEVGTIAFGIVGSSGSVYNQTGSSGSASFTADGGTYTFHTWGGTPGDPYGVTFSGSYESPVL